MFGETDHDVTIRVARQVELPIEVHHRQPINGRRERQDPAEVILVMGVHLSAKTRLAKPQPRQLQQRVVAMNASLEEPEDRRAADSSALGCRRHRLSLHVGDGKEVDRLLLLAAPCVTGIGLVRHHHQLLTHPLHTFDVAVDEPPGGVAGNS